MPPRNPRSTLDTGLLIFQATSTTSFPFLLRCKQAAEMDPFQVRLRFVSALQRVNASLPTIQKALSFVVEHAATLHPELWECITDELKSASINRRINLLFLIDAIFTDDTLSATVRSVYTPHLERDLYLIFDLAVPEDRWNALLNLPAATKMISSWKSRFVLERSLLEDAEKMLEVRRAALYAMSPEKRRKTVVDAGDMQRRIEEDRERHKRLRERAWILPATAYTSQSLFGTRPEQLDPTYLTRTQTASPRAERDDVDGDRVWTTQDLDFSHMWEETSDFNDDDVEAIQEDLKLSWANQPPPPQPIPQPPIHPSRAQERFSASRPPREPASMRHPQRAP